MKMAEELLPSQPALIRSLVDKVVGLVDRAEYKRRQYPPGTKISSPAHLVRIEGCLLPHIGVNLKKLTLRNKHANHLQLVIA